MKRTEFIFLMAALGAVDAFSIDSMLPALDQIGADLMVAKANHRQFIITALFLGFSTGVLIYGFLADQYGRRNPIIAGFLIYVVGSLFCIFAPSFEALILGRMLQGFGAAGPYVLSVAIVRDKYSGRDMAQIMSLIMMVFIGVPMIAPFIGQGIMLLAGWRGIFGILAIYAIGTLLWFWRRQEETLKLENVQTISLATIRSAIVEVATHPITFRYLLAISLVSGAFIAHLSTAQQVFQDIYGLGTRFPIVFASLASLFGLGSYLNSRWVHLVGAKSLVDHALLAITSSSVLLAIYMLVGNVAVPLWMYFIYLSIVMFSYAFLFGNLTSLALEPMGHIAGSASSIITSISTMLAVVVATIVGSQLEGSALPVVIGFGIACLLAQILNRDVIKG